MAPWISLSKLPTHEQYWLRKISLEDLWTQVQIEVEDMKKSKRPKEFDHHPLCDAVIWHKTLGDRREEFYALLDAGADVNEPYDECGTSPLWFAANYGRFEMAKELLKRGAKVDVQDEHGNTPLNNAVYWSKRDGGYDMVRLLLSYGADPNIKNYYDVSPLDLANTIKHNHPDLIDILTKKKE